MPNVPLTTAFRAKIPSKAIRVGPHNLLVREGITFNDRRQIERYYVEDFVGFEMPDLRVSEEENPQEDGSIPGPGFFGSRVMSMTGFIEAGSYPMLSDMERALLDSLIDLGEKRMVITTVPPTVLFVNGVLNPDIGTDTAFWDGAGSDVAHVPGRITTGYGDAECALESTVVLGGAGQTRFNYLSNPAPNGLAVVPGDRVFARVATEIDAASTGSMTAVDANIRWWTAGGSFLSDSPTILLSPATGWWNELLVSAVAPATAAYATLMVKFRNASAGTFIYRVTQAMLTHDQQNKRPAYFDGDSIRSRWTGTPHASSSEFVDSYYEQQEMEIYCRLADKVQLSTRILPTDMGGVLRRPFTIALRATDPLYRSTEVHYAQLVPVVITALGRSYDRGYDLGYTELMDPDGNPAVAGNTIDVTNSGNWPAAPKLRFNGYMNGITLTNNSNGHQLRIAEPVANGDYVDVDVLEGTVVDSLGNDRGDYMDTTSDWLRLAGTRVVMDGINHLSLAVSDYDAQASLELWWQDTNL
jgi:hypothetical protein